MRPELKDKLVRVLLSKRFLGLLSLIIIITSLYMLWDGKDKRVSYMKDGGEVVHESWDKDKDKIVVDKENGSISDVDNSGWNSNKLGDKKYSEIEEDYIKCVDKVVGDKLKVVVDYNYGGLYYSNKDMSGRSDGIFSMVDACYTGYVSELNTNKVDRKDYKNKYKLITEFNNDVKAIKESASKSHLKGDIEGVSSEVKNFKKLSSKLKKDLNTNVE